jgi:hypothetical protein
MTDQREAVGTTARLGEANLFDITGPIVVNYSRTSITGVPLLSYKDGERTLNFSDTEITSVDVSVGELVTVTLDDVVDAFVRTFTILFPKVQLPMGAEVEFDAVGIETVDRSGAFVPRPVPEGVLQTYRVHDLHGIAQLVAF